MNRKLLEKPLAFVQRFRTQSSDSALATEKSGYLEQFRAEEPLVGTKRHSSGPATKSGVQREPDSSIWYVNAESTSSPPAVNNAMTSLDYPENHGTTSNEKRATPRLKPKGTIEYEVKLTDTLASIAAQFDTTPSELIKLNKLVMRTVFPSQILYVPDGSPCFSDEDASISPPALISPPEKLKFDVPIVKMADKPPAKIPGHVERQISLPSPATEPIPPHKLSVNEVETIDKECLERFIKINVKHITDGQGVVSGTLLVTPNAVMFDPNVSDPLAIEHGAEKYGMITPMDMVMSAAMYHDIAAMKLRGQKSMEGSMCKPQIYHTDDCPLFHCKHQHGDSLDHPNNDLGTDMDSMRPSRSTTVDSLRSEVDSMCSCGALSRDVSVNDSLGTPACVENTQQNEADVVTNQQESQNSSLRDFEAIPTTEDKLVEEITGISLQDKTEECDDKNDIISNVLDYSDSFKSDSINTSGDTASVANTSGNTASVAISEETNISDQFTNVETADTNEKKNYEVLMGQSLQTEGDETSQSKLTAAGEKVDTNESKSQIGNISYFPIETNADGKLIVKGEDGSEKTLAKKLSINTNITDDIPEAQFSPLKVSAQHLNNFVNYATGLFRNSSEDQLVKDVHDMRQPIADDLNSKAMTIVDKQLEVENAIKLEDKPSLFQTLDTFELIPKPSSGCDDPPLYLCLRVGQPKYKEVSQTCPIESYRGNKKKPEYWFSIPREKVDQLYAFFVQWTPDIYGDEDDMDPEQRGFVVFDEEDLAAEESLEIIDEHFASIQKIRKDWEIISKVEAIRRMSSVDVEEFLPPPELIGTTTILTYEDQIQLLSNALPPRTIGYPWTLVYSSEQNGFSLKTLYRHMQGLDSPILLVVIDSMEHVFGALVNCPLKISDHFYGTGESFLYTFYPEFKIFHWSGENNFFMKGNQESLAIGAGQGLFGLWFDGDLYHGRSQRCDTFDNDILTESEDFCVRGFEAWAFV